MSSATLTLLGLYQYGLGQNVDMFAKKWQRTFEKWLAVLSEDYKPLANYDRIEEWSDSMSTSSSEFASTSTSDSSISSEAICLHSNSLSR